MREEEGTGGGGGGGEGGGRRGGGVGEGIARLPDGGEWGGRSTRRALDRAGGADEGRRGAYGPPVRARALAILAEMRGDRGAVRLSLAQDRAGPLSNMAMLALLKRMKRDDITVHGFRATFSTWANETAAARPDVIEGLCLAHREGDKIRAAYNRAQFASERRKLLDAWAAFLEGREAASNVIEFTSAKAA